MPAPAGPARFLARLPTLRHLIAPGLLAVLALGAGLWVERHEEHRRFEIDAARSENRALKVRQEALRRKLVEATRQLEALAPEAPTRPGRDRRGAGPAQGREST